MSIDEVMKIASEYRASVGFAEFLAQKSKLQHAIEQHVAEAVAKEREECADAARQWEDDYVIEDSAPRHVDAAIRARADNETQGVRQPCGECHLNLGERCDICGATHEEQSNG